MRICFGNIQRMQKQLNLYSKSYLHENLNSFMESLTSLHLIIKRNIMQPIKSITIPQPCHQNWNQMTPVEQGRHCTQCSKTVTDFTAMTNTEIINYFALNGHVCGRFGETQLAGLNNYLAVEEKPRFSWKRLTIAAAVTGLFATVNANAQNMLGKVKVSQSVNQIKSTPKVDSITFSTIKGKIVDGNDSTALPGVSVMVKGTRIGTQTNANGEFTLRVPSTAESLHISFIGFQNYEAQMSEFTNGYMCVSLKMSAMMLGEPAIVIRKRPGFIKRYFNKVKRAF